MAKEVRDLGASVRARLLNLSRETGQGYDLLLTRFALERLLFRLANSKHADRFILKGAMLLMTWLDDPYRGTRDLDLLGFGDRDPDAVLATFRDILAVYVEDGVEFDSDSLRVERIREADQYGGVRLKLTASVGGARINVPVDIGFGDALEPGAETIEYPVLLDLPAPRLRAYAMETAIAEKFEAMVTLGRANSRMKDFYDIWILSRSFPFDDDRLPRAIAATFRRRGTAIPGELPVALSAGFGTDEMKRRQWTAFIEDLSAHVPPDLASVVDDLAAFLMPHAAAASALG